MDKKQSTKEKSVKRGAKASTEKKSKQEKKLEDFSVDDLLLELKAREALSNGNRAIHKAMATSALEKFESADITRVLQDKQRVIYGTDDRRDMYQVTDPTILNDADSVVVLIDKDQIIDNGNGTSTITGTKFAIRNNLCSQEKFRNQLCAGFCSGFLVAADVIATAGHCVNTGSLPLAETRFVFGFRMTSATNARTVIPNTEIYRGIQVIDKRHTQNGPDWALVRLDRPVTNHPIVRIRRAGKIANNQAVHVIGHPVGLPTKYAPNAQVRENNASAFFVANLDTYGGNSGSPVFNSNDHTVEGILVRGATDFVSVGNCNVSNVCPTSGCSGESVNRTTEFSHLI